MQVMGAASQNNDECSTSAPKVCKMREALPFCKANPNWIPKKTEAHVKDLPESNRGFSRALLDDEAG